jgi:hypothetical protein
VLLSQAKEIEHVYGVPSDRITAAALLPLLPVSAFACISLLCSFIDRVIRVQAIKFKAPIFVVMQQNDVSVHANDFGILQDLNLKRVQVRER